MGAEMWAPWIQAGAQTGQGAMGIGIQRIGAKYDRKQQLKTQEKMMALQMKGNREMMDYQQQLQMDMWKNTGPQGQMEQLKAAGLNPGLIYGMGGAGGQTTGQTGGAGVTGGQAPYVDTTSMGLQMGGANLAQIRLMNAQADNLDADTANKGGVEKERTIAQTKDYLQGVDNKKAELRLTQIKGDIADIEREIQDKSKQDQIEIIGKESERASGEIERLFRQNTIEKAVMQDRINMVKADLAQIYATTRLTEAQTKTEKGKPALQQAEIKALGEKVWQMTREGAQKWRELELKGADVNTNREKLAEEMFKNSGLPPDIAQDIVTFILLKGAMQYAPAADAPKPYFMK